MIDLTTPFTMEAWKYYGTWTLICVLIVWLLIEIRLHRNADRRATEAYNSVTAHEEEMALLQIQKRNITDSFNELNVRMCDSLNENRDLNNTIQSLKAYLARERDNAIAIATMFNAVNAELEGIKTAGWYQEAKAQHEKHVEELKKMQVEGFVVKKKGKK